MPHIIVEYSDNLGAHLNIQLLLHDLHASIDGKHNVALSRIKTRAHEVQNYVVGEKGMDGSMVHIELKLMPGRDDAQKTELSGILLETALKHIGTAPAFTVEVSELHGPSYRG